MNLAGHELGTWALFPLCCKSHFFFFFYLYYPSHPLSHDCELFIPMPYTLLDNKPAILPAGINIQPLFRAYGSHLKQLQFSFSGRWMGFQWKIVEEMGSQTFLECMQIPFKRHFHVKDTQIISFLLAERLNRQQHAQVAKPISNWSRNAVILPRTWEDDKMQDRASTAAAAITSGFIKATGSSPLPTDTSPWLTLLITFY